MRDTEIARRLAANPDENPDLARLLAITAETATIQDLLDLNKAVIQLPNYQAPSGFQLRLSMSMLASMAAYRVLPLWTWPGGPYDGQAVGDEDIEFCIGNLAGVLDASIKMVDLGYVRVLQVDLIKKVSEVARSARERGRAEAERGEARVLADAFNDLLRAVEGYWGRRPNGIMTYIQWVLENIQGEHDVMAVVDAYISGVHDRLEYQEQARQAGAVLVSGDLTETERKGN